jgi:hypothetical protein
MAHDLHPICATHVKKRTMPTRQREDDKNRRDSRKGSTEGASEPQIPDVDPADLDDDQADSGPDRDHKELAA